MMNDDHEDDDNWEKNTLGRELPPRFILFLDSFPRVHLAIWEGVDEYALGEGEGGGEQPGVHLGGGGVPGNVP
jgi:hypothetical protein